MLARLHDITDQGLSIPNHAKPYQTRRGSAQGTMVHRVGVDKKLGVVIGDDGPAIVDAFLGRDPAFPDVPKYTGYKCPYTFLVGAEGHIWQALPIGLVGPHARSASHSYIGVACIGDFREDQPTDKQWAALVELCSELRLCLDVRGLAGHGEVAGSHGGEKAPGMSYACPGDKLSMRELRFEVERTVQRERSERLSAYGIVM